MTLNNKIVAIVLFSIMLSCNTNNKNKQKILYKEYNTKLLTQKNHDKKQWSYSGETSPDHWADIEKDSECDGNFQSPINIVSINAVLDNELKPLDIHYKEDTKIFNVKNNGHSIQYNFEEGDYINYKGYKFNLKQIHFHESSEHTIDGVRYPLVIHLVHTNDKGEYLVLAIMAKEGLSSESFNFLESYLPLKNGELKIINMPFNLNLNLPKNRGYFNYIGSLTTPPCTQGVNWFIFKEPITISLKQVEVLKKIMPINNYRTEQPLNGRKVKMLN